MSTANVQIKINVTPEVAARLDALAGRLASLVPGMEAKRTDAVRAALAKGLDVLEPGEAPPETEAEARTKLASFQSAARAGEVPAFIMRQMGAPEAEIRRAHGKPTAKPQPHRAPAKKAAKGRRAR